MKTLLNNTFIVPLVVLVGFSELAPKAHAQGGVPLWTNRFDGGFVPHMAVDRAGTVLVTGEAAYNSVDSLNQCITIAYSSAGIPLWTNFYGPRSRVNASGSAIAVDKNGRVFVAGEYVDYGTSFSGNGGFMTLAYSTAGVLLWTNHYVGPGDVFDSVAGIAVNANGNVVVTGNCQNSNGGTHYEYATVAYSGAGIALWTNRYTGSGDCFGSDNAAAIAADQDGNVFVTGSSCLAGSRVYTTLAYSGSGVPLWTNYYGAGAAVAIGVDGNGKVFVTGSSLITAGDSAYATVAYSGAGVPLWTNWYNGPEGIGDQAEAIAIDTKGRVYVTGTDDVDSGSQSYATVAYSGEGVPLWTNRWGGPGIGECIATDSSGNVFVSGYPYTTVAYSEAGVPLWTNYFTGVGYGIAVDPDGNVIVAGTGYAIIKYSSSIPLVHLDFQRLNNQLVLNWTNAGFDLQSAPLATGTFTNITGAVSPYTNPLAGPQQYFRLAAP